MAKIETQSIPSELLDLYEGALQPAAIYKGGKMVRKRYPWRLPWCQGNGRWPEVYVGGARVSIAQFDQRAIFRKCVDCYNLQDPSHDIIDPPAGPKSRGYWYNAADGTGLWYYDYFMQKTIDFMIINPSVTYCEVIPTAINSVVSWAPDDVYNNMSIGYVNMYLEGEEERESWVYVQNPNNRVMWLNCKLQYANWNWTQYKYILMQVNETDDVWDPDTLTWNNKPPRLALKYLFLFSLPMAQWTEKVIHIPIYGMKGYAFSVLPYPGEYPDNTAIRIYTHLHEPWPAYQS